MDNSQMKHIWDKRKTNKRLTPMNAIRFYCKEFCCCGDTLSWKECQLPYCPLYPLRMGKRPSKTLESPSSTTKKKKSQEVKNE